MSSQALAIANANPAVSGRSGDATASLSSSTRSRSPCSNVFRFANVSQAIADCGDLRMATRTDASASSSRPSRPSCIPIARGRPGFRGSSSSSLRVTASASRNCPASERRSASSARALGLRGSAAARRRAASSARSSSPILAAVSSTRCQCRGSGVSTVAAFSSPASRSLNCTLSLTAVATCSLSGREPCQREVARATRPARPRAGRHRGGRAAMPSGLLRPLSGTRYPVAPKSPDRGTSWPPTARRSVIARCW